jgi:chromate transport protein ChrA
MFVASIPLAGYLAYERGRSQRRWALAAVMIGPFAIPMLYFVAAISSFRKTNVSRH